MDALHVNTVEAPIYWEQLEPRPGVFDYAAVDMLLAQAREHRVHLVLLWFATWKERQPRVHAGVGKAGPRQVPVSYG